MKLQISPENIIQEDETLAREASPWKPTVVYYLHFKDDRYFINNWNRRGDYVCCVMARTIGEAIEKTEKILGRC